MSKIERLSLGVNRIIEYLLAVLGLFMAFIVAAQVFARYVLNHSIFWSEELARFLLIWLTFLGASVAYRRGAHASIEVIHQRLPAAVRHWAMVIVHSGALFFALILIYYGARFAHFVRHQISPALYLPKWIPHGIIPICGLVLALHALAFLWAELKRGDSSGDR